MIPVRPTVTLTTAVDILTAAIIALVITVLAFIALAYYRQAKTYARVLEQRHRTNGQLVTLLTSASNSLREVRQENQEMKEHAAELDVIDSQVRQHLRDVEQRLYESTGEKIPHPQSTLHTPSSLNIFGADQISEPNQPE